MHGGSSVHLSVVIHMAVVIYLAADMGLGDYAWCVVCGLGLVCTLYS